MPESKFIESGKLLCLEQKGALRDAQAAFRQLEDYARQKRVTLKGGFFIVVYEKLPDFNRGQAHYAAAAELGGECNGDGDFTVVIQSASMVAYETCPSAPEQLGAAYQGLLAWIQEHGYEVSGPAREFAFSGSAAGQDAAMVEIQIPVLKK